IRKLRRLKRGNWLAYAWPWLQAKVSELIPQAVKDTTNAAVCACFLSLGLRIPHSLRSFYTLRVYTRARKIYRAPVYTGELSIFACAGRTVFERWRKLATGRLSVLEIPCDHRQIREEPFVQLWAEELRNSLRAAQSRISDK